MGWGGQGEGSILIATERSPSVLDENLPGQTL